MSEINIRHIKPSDDASLAIIIRRTLEEFGANHPGTVYYDSSTDHLSDLFNVPKAVYHVVEVDGEVAGGAGIYPTEGLPEDTCELVKMYLGSKARGLGLGKILMNHCITAAAAEGFGRVYLETMPELTIAVPMYKKFGFVNLPGPLGNSGHHGCHIWMVKVIR
ncbi:MAG: GNAT family N-acetyltransferase [Chitinophagaceae bacterium]